MKLKSVTIQGLHNTAYKKYEFNNLTYLHGPNGAGKSTVLQAIQLALLGYIPGTNKTKSAIFRHAGDRTMSVTLEIDDNGNPIIIRRSWVAAKSQIVDTLETTPDGLDVHSLIADIELPLFDFNQFSGMTANQLKDWFLNFLPADEVQIDWKRVLSDALEADGVVADSEVVTKAVESVHNLNLTGLEEIRAANSLFKQMQSFTKSEVDRLTSTVRTLVYYDDVADTDLNSVHAKISAANNMIDACHKRDIFYAKNEDRRAKLAAFAAEGITATSAEEDPKVKDLIISIQEKQNEIIRLKSEQADIEDKMSAYLAEKGALGAVLQQKGVCPVTHETCDSISAMYDQYAQRDTELVAAMTDLRSRRANIEGTLTTLSLEINSATQARDERVRKYKTRDELSNGAEADPFADVIGTVEEWRAEAVRLMEVASKVEANIKYSKLSEDVLREKYKAEQEAEAYKSFVKVTGVNGLQSSAGSSNTFLRFAADLAPKLAALFGDDSVGAGFDLQEKANTFSFGIYRKDKYIPYDLLSSGEKCVYVLALSVQLLKYSKSPLKLVMVDDLLDHLDDDRIARVFKAAADGLDDTQFIFAGVKDVNTKECVVEL